MITTREFASLISEEALTELLDDMVEMRRCEEAMYLHFHMARMKNFRPKTMMQLNSDSWRKLLVSCWKKIPLEDVGKLLVRVHSEKRENDVTGLYRLLGVEHDGIKLSNEDDPNLEPPDFVAVWDEYIDMVGEDRARIVLTTISVAGVKSWRHNASTVMSSILDQQMSPLVIPAASEGVDDLESWDGAAIVKAVSLPDSESEVPEQSTVEPEFIDYPDFSTMDKVLIRTIVSSANQTDSCLDAGEVLDLVIELQSLNDGRTRSWFHPGFVCSLQDREFEARGAGENDARRAWWLCGYLMGKLRQSTPENAYQQLHQLDPADANLILNPGVSGNTSLGGAVMISQELFLTALDNGDHEQTINWLAGHGPHLPQKFIPSVMAWVRSSADGTADIKDTCVRLLENCMIIIEDLAVEVRPPASYLDEILRHLLPLLLEEGKFGAVARQIEKAKEMGVHLRAENRALAALMHLGIEGPEQLRLPRKKQTLSTYLERLGSQSDSFSKAAREGSATGTLAMAQLLLSENDLDEKSRSDAIDLIHQHRSSLENVRGRQQMTQQFRLVQSVLELRNIRTGSGNAACDRLLRLLNEGVEAPSDLLRECLETAALLDLSGTQKLAEYHLEHADPAEIARIPVEELGSRSHGLLELFCKRVKSSGLRKNEIWKVWKQILGAALNSTEDERAIAEEAIDSLEELALNSGGEHDEGLLDVFNQDLSPIWEEEDIAGARARLHEIAGNREDECAQLRRLAEIKLRKGDEDASGVISRLRELNYDAGELESCEARLPQGEIAEVEATALTGTILCVGGNETQKRYEDQIRQNIGASHPDLRLEFEYPGWSSNWHISLSRIEEKLNRFDGVVILKLVRTQFGRNLRKSIGEEGKIWQACTGHGRDYIQRMILLLAQRIRDQLPQC
ncbi:MAG TPA: hypothetical protein EYN40_07475 [Planctomycetes bacterium]|nr:hypothetical protein [Planctomycetota bacterium]